MRRVAFLVAASSVLALTLVSCGRDPTVGAEASAVLTPEVSAIRGAAEAGEREEATEQLAELRGTVAELRSSGRLTSAGADRILAAISDVEAQLRLLPGGSGERVVPGRQDEPGPKTATTQRQRGKGGDKDDDEDGDD